MIRVLASVSVPGPALADGFGRRVRGIDPDVGDEVELLEFSAPLVEHAGFVAALGDRVARIASVRHTSYVHLRRLDRPAPDRLSLVSDFTPGWRLSELLRASAASRVPYETTVVIGLLRQLLPAVALFSRHNRDSAIGTLAPERLIVTPQARLVIAEHAFGPALEKLNLGRDRLWRECRVAMPPSAGLPRANARADTNAVGIVALSLVLGRVIGDDEYPGSLAMLIESAQERRNGEDAPLSAPFSQWLSRAMQFDVRTSFQTPHEAQVAFEAVLASDRGYVTKTTVLEEWVTRVGGAIDAANVPPPEPAPIVVAPPVAIAPAQQVPAPAEAPKAPEAPEPPEAPRAPQAPLAPSAPEAPRAPQAPAAPHEAAPYDEALQAPQMAPQLVVRLSPFRSPLVIALFAIVALLTVAVAWLWLRPPTEALVGEGELVVQSRPLARVSIDGDDRGTTPLTMRLPAGAHVLEVRIGKSEPRVIPLNIRNGAQTSQYIELQNVPTIGGLDIRTDPAGAQITVDGKSKGTTPVTLRDLAPGDHEVVLEFEGRQVKQVMRIDAGVTAQLVVPMARR